MNSLATATATSPANVGGVATLPIWALLIKRNASGFEWAFLRAEKRVAEVWSQFATQQFAEPDCREFVAEIVGDLTGQFGLVGDAWASYQAAWSLAESVGFADDKKEAIGLALVGLADSLSGLADKLRSELKQSQQSWADSDYELQPVFDWLGFDVLFANLAVYADWVRRGLRDKFDREDSEAMSCRYYELAKQAGGCNE